jgi:hypothetical protein
MDRRVSNSSYSLSAEKRHDEVLLLGGMKMRKQKKPPVFREGERVCYISPERKDIRIWCLGRIISFPLTKSDKESVVEVMPYEIPERYRLREPEAEWSSFDPLPFEFPREAIILNRLCSRMRVEREKKTKTVEVPLRDLCKASFVEFREALVGVKTSMLPVRRLYW